MEVCVLDDIYDEWLDKLGQMLEDQEDSEEGDVDRRIVPGQIQRMPFRPHAEEGLILEKTGVRHAMWRTDVPPCCENGTREGNESIRTMCLRLCD